MHILRATVESGMAARPALTSLIPREAFAESECGDQAVDNTSPQLMNVDRHGQGEMLDPADQELLRKAASGIRLRGS